MERKSYESGIESWSEVLGRMAHDLIREGREEAGVAQWVNLKGEVICPEGGEEGMVWSWH